MTSSSSALVEPAIVPKREGREEACPQPRGKERESVSEAATVTEGARRARQREKWAALLERCFGVDVTACGKCGGRMRLVALIEDREVAKKLLDHLGVRSTGPPLAPARAPPQAEFEGFDPPWADDVPTFES